MGILNCQMFKRDIEISASHQVLENKFICLTFDKGQRLHATPVDVVEELQMSFLGEVHVSELP